MSSQVKQDPSELGSELKVEEEQFTEYDSKSNKTTQMININSAN